MSDSYILSIDSSLKEAIDCLSKNDRQIVLIVDKNRVLQGTVTDGDVRRSLLSGNGLDICVTEVMNSNPVTLPSDCNDTLVRNTMRQFSIKQIPIVDHVGKVDGLRHIEEFLGAQPVENAALLMAGGFGKRLLPLTEHTPKPMLKISDKPILEIIIRQLIDAGFRKFFISTHYMAESIVNHFGDGTAFGISIEYLHETTPLGTAGALALLPEISRPILVMNGDILSRVNFQQLMEFHDQNEAKATMVVRDYEHVVPFAVIENDGQFITSIKEKPKISHFINAGIYVLSPAICNAMRDIEKKDMPDVLSQLIGQNYPVAMFPLHEYWSDIGLKEEFEKAHSLFKQYHF